MTPVPAGEHWDDWDEQIKRWRHAKVHGWISRGWKRQTTGRPKQRSEARIERRMNPRAMEGLCCDYYGTQVGRCDLAANIPHPQFQKSPKKLCSLLEFLMNDAVTLEEITGGVGLPLMMQPTGSNTTHQRKLMKTTQPPFVCSFSSSSTICALSCTFTRIHTLATRSVFTCTQGNQTPAVVHTLVGISHSTWIFGGCPRIIYGDQRERQAEQFTPTDVSSSLSCLSTVSRLLCWAASSCLTV